MPSALPQLAGGFFLSDGGLETSLVGLKGALPRLNVLGGCCGTDWRLWARLRPPPLAENDMDEETFNLSIRKFLKLVGISSQREIEQAVAKAVAAGETATSFPATMTLQIPGLKLDVKFDGEIKLG